jgi:hypothetical protein
LLLLPAVLIGLLIAVQVSAASPSAFCSGAAVHDFLAPLATLPQVRSLPRSGRLGVGPGYLRIYPPHETLVAIGPGRFEAQGSLEGSLGWTVISRLVPIHHGQETLGGLKVRRQYLATSASFGHRFFGFSARVNPGIYRLDLEIRDRKGRRLRRFGEYFRAVEAISRLRVKSSQSSIAPGEKAYLRLENAGTVEATYGLTYKVRNERGEEVPVSTITPAVRLALRPGYASRCLSFTMPDGTPTGSYRVYLPVSDVLTRSVVVTTIINVR